MENTQRPPKSYLAESILVTIFCCMPFGIAGIVNAANVESRFYAGDIEGATRASVQAKKWTMWSLWSALILGVIYIMFLILVAFISAAS